MVKHICQLCDLVVHRTCKGISLSKCEWGGIKNNTESMDTWSPMESSLRNLDDEIGGSQMK